MSCTHWLVDFRLELAIFYHNKIHKVVFNKITLGKLFSNFWQETFQHFLILMKAFNAVCAVSSSWLCLYHIAMVIVAIKFFTCHGSNIGNHLWYGLTTNVQGTYTRGYLKSIHYHWILLIISTYLWVLFLKNYSSLENLWCLFFPLATCYNKFTIIPYQTMILGNIKCVVAIDYHWTNNHYNLILWSTVCIEFYVMLFMHSSYIYMHLAKLLSSKCKYISYIKSFH